MKVENILDADALKALKFGDLIEAMDPNLDLDDFPCCLYSRFMFVGVAPNGDLIVAHIDNLDPSWKIAKL